MDILTVGHCTIDLFMSVQGNSVSEEGAKMCFYHGSKIEASEFETSVGGNAFNVAVGTKKLGLDATIYTELGDDSFSTQILNEIKTNEIDSSLIENNNKTKTNVSVIISYDNERTILGYRNKQSYNVSGWKSPKIIYYTSMPEGFESFQKQLISYRKNHPECIIVFNPGTIQLRSGLESMKPVLKITDILIVNKEEAKTLTKETSLISLHKSLQKLGPKLTAITLGEKGASAHDGTTLVKTGARKCPKKVLDKTGAGDAFTSAFISAIFFNESLKNALEWGVVNGSHVLSEIGPTKGLLTKKGVLKFL